MTKYIYSKSDFTKRSYEKWQNLEENICESVNDTIQKLTEAFIKCTDNDLFTTSITIPTQYEKVYDSSIGHSIYDSFIDRLCTKLEKSKYIILKKHLPKRIDVTWSQKTWKEKFVKLPYYSMIRYWEVQKELRDNGFVTISTAQGHDIDLSNLDNLNNNVSRIQIQIPDENIDNANIYVKIVYNENKYIKNIYSKEEMLTILSQLNRFYL